MDPATGVPNFVSCVSGDTSLTLGGHNPESCVCMRDHFPILVGSSVQTYTQYLLMRCHPLQVPKRANHGMSSKRLWLAATTGASTKVVSTHRHYAGLYSTCVLESRCQLLTMQCDYHDRHELTGCGGIAAGVQGQSHDFAQDRLAVRGCHATAVSLVM